MKIQINTANSYDGSEALEHYVTDKIEKGLKHYEDKISRVEVHLADLNADKGGPNDMQCMIETRIEGLDPIAVTSKGDTDHRAINDATDKMQAALRTVVGKMKDVRV